MFDKFWERLWDRASQEWQEVRRVPVTLTVVAIAAFGVGYVAANWYSSREINSREALLREKDGQLGRYRIALGIDEASAGALVELNSVELRTKARATASKLRRLQEEVAQRVAGVRKLRDDKKTDEKSVQSAMDTISRDASAMFTKDGLKAEALNVDSELRRRLGREALGSIVGIGPTVYSNEGAPVGLASLMSSAGGESAAMFDISHIGVLALAIERMADVLPSDK